MDYQKYSHRFLTGFAALILILSGCGPEVQKPEKVCACRKTAAELMSLLKHRLENTVPLEAKGSCLLRYHNKEGKAKKENFLVKLWVNPPVEIYMQGDVAFNPKGIVLGSNEEEFWLAVKPREISGYWWGRWAKSGRPEKLMISPRRVLEALGVVAFEDMEKCSLSHEEAFEVFTRRQSSAGTGRIYIDNCDYLVRRIEYFDDEGRAAVVTELDKYRKVSEDFFVPSVIKIVSQAGSDKEGSIQITLMSVKPASLTDKRRERLFTRPEPKGFKNIYEIVGGDIIEQPQ